jgi:pimeloyl-ACP methyl ester carboxylesterase
VRTRLILVHGTRVSHVQWSAHRRWLEPRFEVVLPDLPGHGARATEPFTMDAAVAVVAEAVEDASPGQPVVLVGHSLGGYVAMTYAAAHPDRLAGLILIGATAVPRGAGAAASQLLGWATERAGEQRVTRFNNWLLSKMAPAEVFAAIEQDGYWFEAVRAAWAAVLAGGRPELLRDVRCPVLIVRGQFDQIGIHAYRYAAQAQDARVVTVRRASHLLPLTRPWQTSAIIAGFAGRVRVGVPARDGPSTMRRDVDELSSGGAHDAQLPMVGRCIPNPRREIRLR